MYKHFILIFALGLFLCSCFPDSEFEEQPSIEYESFEADSSVGRLRIDFTDGDGDIGLNRTGEDMEAPYDSGSFYHHNLYLIYEEKDDQNGWQTGLDLSGDSIVFEYRIQRIENSSSRGLRGTLEVELSPSYYNPTSQNSDTIRYRMKLIDRSLKESEWVYTEPITR